MVFWGGRWLRERADEERKSIVVRHSKETSISDARENIRKLAANRE